MRGAVAYAGNRGRTHDGDIDHSWRIDCIARLCGRLRAGRHCAVDPDIIPLWSKIRILNGKREWVAVDTGSAVKSKKASQGKLPVVDVFAASEKQFKAMRLPRVATVEVSR